MMTFNETAEILRLYFIQCKYISLNSLGCFELKRKPAQFDSESGRFSSPEYYVDFTTSSLTHSKNVVGYLSKRMNIGEIEASTQLDSFVNTIMIRLKTGERVEWSDMGSWQLVNEIVHFTPFPIELAQLKDIVIPSSKNELKNAEDNIPEITEDDYIEANEHTVQKWNMYLLILALLSVVLMAISIFQHNRFILHKTGAVNPATIPEQFQTIPAE